jgi:hypothetical protein
VFRDQLLDLTMALSIQVSGVRTKRLNKVEVFKFGLMALSTKDIGRMTRQTVEDA